MKKTTSEDTNNNQSTVLRVSDALSRNTMMYLIFSALVGLFIYTVLQGNTEKSSLQTWIVCIEANTAILGIFHYISSRKKINPFSNIFFTGGFLFNGFIWGALGSIVLPQIAADGHILIIMSLVAIVALGVPLFVSSPRLVFLFSSVVLIQPAIYYFSEMNALSIGKGLIISTLIPVAIKVVKISRDFQSRSASLMDKHQRLIDQLNVAVEKTETTNLELINEINEKKQTETELIKARDDAEAAVKAKSEFLATMSHEIRTPMNGVLGMAELLIGTELTSKQNRFAETIHKSGSALLTIINDILDFSKIEAGKLELNKTVFDLRLLIEELGVMFASQAHQKGLELTCNFPADGHSMFRGDAERIRQILVNLMGNALKFTEKGEILLKVELFTKEDDMFLIRFRVRDTGIGISDAAQEKIFDSFSQADGSTTRKFGGTGLGLTICKMLTELMGGTIGIKSKPDVGSTFWFSIPLKKEAAITQSVSRPSSHIFKGMRALIADNNKTNRELLEQQFTNWGMDYYSVDNGKNALRALQEAAQQGNSFSLAVLDNQLSGIDGITLARKINKDSKLSDTKIIMLSSVGNMEETGQWLMAGVESYLSKPIRQNELYESVYKAIGTGHDNSVEFEKANVVPKQSKVTDLKGHILVAEDNMVNQELAREMITNLGCTVEIVDNGLQAFEAISESLLDNIQKPYDLILMDCQMPEMDGFEATKNLRQWEGQQKVLQRIPIIALTANAMEGDRDKCIAAGMDDYMTKPFTLVQLGAMLHRWLPLLAKENNSEYARHNENVKDSQSTVEKEEGVTQLESAALERIRKLQRDGQPNVVIKVIKLFLENTQKTILILESAISKGDNENLQRSAYSLQSSCSTVGATDLARLCAELESLGRTGNAGVAQSRLSVLEYEYDAVCTALQNVIEDEAEIA